MKSTDGNNNHRHMHLDRIRFLKGPLSLGKTVGNLLWNFNSGCERKTWILTSLSKILLKNQTHPNRAPLM